MYVLFMAVTFDVWVTVTKLIKRLFFLYLILTYSYNSINSSLKRSGTTMSVSFSSWDGDE